MSSENLMDTKKTENDFCSICLRTKSEGKLDPISTKMYQMFFVGLVKCGELKKANRSICVWCRRRVVDALKLVETAQISDRLLAQIENSHCQSSKQIVCEQIQTTKRAGLNPRISRVITYSLPQDTRTCLPVKLEREVLDSVIDKSEMDVLASITSQVVSRQLLPDAGFALSAKLERKDGIFDEGRNNHLGSIINKDELDNKPTAPDNHHFLALRARSETDNELASELDITEKIPCINENKKRSKPKTDVVMKKKMKEIELYGTLHTEVLKVEHIDADGNQNSASEVINENAGSEFRERVSKNGLQDDERHVVVEDSDTNSQTTYSSADALKHIRPMQLTETQRLQELEERRREARYRNAAFKCEPCALNFAFRNTYDAHMERHSENFGSYKCSICGVYQQKVNSHRQHCKNHYRRYACTVCGFNYPRKDEALDHYLSQHTDQRYKCEHCASEFRKPSVLKQHMKTVHDVERPLFPCSHCSQVLRTKFSYNLHMTQHNHGILCTHRCKVCSRTFRTAYDLRKHQVTHSKEKTIFCQQCGDGFKLRSALHMHTKRKHSDVYFECDYCQKAFSVKTDLKVHITWVHLRRGHNCKLCSKVLPSSYLLKRHIKKKHEGWTEPRDKMCDVCGQGFSLNSILKIHRHTHSTERPYPCSVCTATFKHRSTVKSHRRLVHKIKE